MITMDLQFFIGAFTFSIAPMGVYLAYTAYRNNKRMSLVDI